MADLLITCRRIGTAYTGKIDDWEFDGFTYADMMYAANNRLVRLPEGSGVVLHRTDRANLLPIKLDAAATQLLRENPAAYIQQTSHASVRVDLTGGEHGDRTRVGQGYNLPKYTGLRAGHATLAAAFGERVYLRVRNDLVESPKDGRYTHDYNVTSWLGADIYELTTRGERKEWVTVRTEDLLKVDALRLYIPREWNEFGLWITKVQLQEKYNQYMKELVTWQSEATATTP